MILFSVAVVLAHFSAVAFSDDFIQFSGYKWKVKSGVSNPGPNTYSASNVFVDSNGYLHLRIRKENNTWTASEVYTEDGLPYGTYLWVVKGDLSHFQPSIVLGLFTWDSTAPEYAYREIDIEIAKWNQERKDNSQFVVQPSQIPGNLIRFTQDYNGVAVFQFTWTKEKVSFSASNATSTACKWDYVAADIPPAGSGGPHMNLWMFNNTPPLDENPVEIVIQQFSLIEEIDLAARTSSVCFHSRLQSFFDVIYNFIKAFF